MIPYALIAMIGKEAAAKTVRSGTVPAATPGDREAAVAALAADLRPASHVPPTRYGRKPYRRGASPDPKPDAGGFA